MRIVVDTNVIISAVFWMGPPHHIIELAEEKRITLCVTEAMLAELQDVLRRRKFQRALQLRRTSVEEIMSALLPLVELYPPTTI
ncbi:MAG: putative toxin-antitoxin system toxin component, PIN family [Chloroflexi bacterium]|nr:putative toxin-antitoxin system toxin component, PIN family [Chloroflexota bacterium]